MLSVFFALLLLNSPQTFPSPPDEVTLRIWDGLNLERVTRGAPPFERGPELDRAASLRAAEIASLPHASRLNREEGIEEFLERVGAGGYGEIRERVILLGGVEDPSPEVLKLWRNYDLAWKTAMDPAWKEVGLGWVPAEDGWFVFVAILGKPRVARPPADSAALEKKVLALINRERTNQGLAPLLPSPVLEELARAHSLDMATGAPFDHQSPKTGSPEDRVTKAGLNFQVLAENIAMNLNADDPARTAVEGWLRSSHHRANILDPRFRETGVGIAEGPHGGLFFTQIFLTPAEP